MKFEIVSAKLTGAPNSLGWSQVHDFTPQDPAKLAKRGRLIAVIAVSTPPTPGQETRQVDTVAAGREILTRLHEEYFGNLEGSAFNGLTNAITKVIGEFANFGTVEIGALCVVGDVVYVAVGGGVQAMLLRNGSLSTLLESTTGKTISASGYSRDDDVFLLATKAFIAHVPQEVIKKSLTSTTPAQAAETMGPTAFEGDTPGSFAATIVAFGESAQIPAIKKDEEGQKQEPPAPRPGVKERLAARIDSVVTKIPRGRLIVKSDMKDLEDDKRKKTAVTVGILLLIILATSIGFGIWQKRLNQDKQKYEDKIVQATHELEEAESLVDLNPSRARELVLSAKSIAQTLTDEGIKDPRLDDLVTTINVKLGAVAGIYEASTNTFLDLSLIASGFSGDQLVLSDDRMLVLDKNTKRLVSIGVETKKTQVVAGPDELSSPQSIAIYADRNFVLDTFGVSEVNNGVELVVHKDWDNPLIAAYTGNIYVLDKDQGMVWRYAGAGGSFGEGSQWFGAGVNPDLSDAKTWAIDGAIWVLENGGKITKFTMGKQDPFAINGLEKGVEGATDIYTSDDDQYLYILDSSNSRVVVVTKEGDYKAQYINSEIKNAKKIVASESAHKLIILTGDKLLDMQLKHL